RIVAETLDSPATSSGVDISNQSVGKEYKEQSKELRETSEEVVANVGEGRDAPKRVFPKRRKNRNKDEDSVKTEHTIYERRKKAQRGSTIINSPQKTQSCIDDLEKAVEAPEIEGKRKSLFDSVREWFEEQCTQRQNGEALNTQSSSSFKKSKSKALFSCEGGPSAKHKLLSEKTARSPSASIIINKESLEVNVCAGPNDSDSVPEPASNQKA
ncbi:unnamed protein product, partial [Strongylus vulgaris]